MRIENWSAVGKKREASDILDALQAALRAADPQTILDRTLKLDGRTLRVCSETFDLSMFTRIVVIGGGKAAGGMALALERILGNKITAGIVNIPDNLAPIPPCQRVGLHRASHPIPSQEGVKGVKMMLNLVGERPTVSDLVICLISGGGSALLPMPEKGLSLSDLQTTTELMLNCGAEIHEINVVRKHLSGITGGRLAERLYPATVISLIISDVVGDDLDSIASGPTAPDPSTYVDAQRVLIEHELLDKVPGRVQKALRSGALGRVKETPKASSVVFERVHNMIVGTNELSCRAAADVLRKKGYATMILTTSIQGEAKEMGKLFSGLLVEMTHKSLPMSPPACIIAGGETTVTARGRGVGGRNQELCLSVALGIAGLKNACFASIGTDGLDGQTEAAGAIVDGEVVSLARGKGLDPELYLQSNDSHTFFRKVGGLVLTGATGTNVNDIMIAVASE
jgi:glycerate 2-kinase